MQPTFCRNCLTIIASKVSFNDQTDAPKLEACQSCGSNLIIAHDELFKLPIVHIDCDSFYASVEKRDRPELRSKPLLIGGQERGVVAAACYIARLYGVRSAMPMFQAKKLCPHAVILPPDITKYQATSRIIRRLMQELTDLVEPLSIDEAFLDLTQSKVDFEKGLTDTPPALIVARLVKKIELQSGVSASIGLGPNKFLAKLASDLDKPRGFAVIGAKEAVAFLKDRPIKDLWGVGPQLAKKLSRSGFSTIGQLQNQSAKDMQRRFGKIGLRLVMYANGEDDRKVSIEREAKSVSAETTFSTDIKDRQTLKGEIDRLIETVVRRMQAQQYACSTITVKFRTHDFRLLTRSTTIPQPTSRAERLSEVAHHMIDRLDEDGPFRLIGIGGSELISIEFGDLPDLLEHIALR